MKSLLLIITMLSLAGPAHFRIVSAEAQPWSAGMEEGGQGTDFSITLVINTRANITFDSIWVKERCFKLRATKKQFNMSDKKFNRNDTIVLRATYNKQNIQTKIKTPVKTSGEALISYKVNGKKYYCTISKLRNREAISYP